MQHGIGLRGSDAGPMTILLRGLFAGMPGMIEDDQGDGKPWYSGFAKAPLSGRVPLHADHLEGDG